MMNQQTAQTMLKELGAESCKSTDFNNDDWYTYNTDTLECLPDNGSSKNQPSEVPAPFVVVRGFKAAYLGLWRYKNERRHNSVIIRETLENMALMGEAA